MVSQDLVVDRGESRESDPARCQLWGIPRRWPGTPHNIFPVLPGAYLRPRPYDLGRRLPGNCLNCDKFAGAAGIAVAEVVKTNGNLDQALKKLARRTLVILPKFFPHLMGLEELAFVEVFDSVDKTGIV